MDYSTSERVHVIHLVAQPRGGTLATRKGGVRFDQGNALGHQGSLFK